MVFPYTLIVVFLMFLPSAVSAGEALDLSSSIAQSSDGSFNISWSLPGNRRIQLQQAKQNQPDYRTIYTGSDASTVITGLSNGDYRYRARMLDVNDAASDWTEPLTVNVRHHSLARAFSFFVVGAVVFTATLLLIVFGIRPGRAGVQS